MREPAYLSRRTITAALPLEELHGASSAASAPVSTPIRDNGDAELLDLGRRWQAALAAEEAESLIDCSTMSTAEADACDALRGLA